MRRSRFVASALTLTFATTSWVACASHDQEAEKEPELAVELPEAPPPPEPPPPPDQVVKKEPVAPADAFACWWRASDPGLFSDRVPDDKMVQHGERKVGPFMGGINSVLYMGLVDCIHPVAEGEWNDWQNARPIAEYAGVPLYGEKMNESQPFGYYNPELVKWGHENLIPDPDSLVDGVAMQLIYDHSMSRFVRMMSEARLELLSRGSIDKELDRYLKATTRNANPVDAVDYLHQRYGDWLGTYAIERDYSSMTAPMAIGFWLRRHADGTEAELWVGLRKLMQTYDDEYWGELQGRYPKAAVKW